MTKLLSNGRKTVAGLVEKPKPGAPTLQRSLSLPAIKFTFDEVRAEQLVDSIYGAYVNERGLYKFVRAETHGPQHRFIPGNTPPQVVNQGLLFDEVHVEHKEPPPGISRGSRQHLVWLLFATLTDRRQVSGGEKGVYASQCLIHQQYPWLYTREVLKLSVKELAEILIQFKIGVPRQSAQYWLPLAMTLFEEFDGNPVAMFKTAGSTIENVQKWKRRIEKERGYDPIPGFGPKITSLYLMYIAELGALPFPKDAFAVDVHVQRLFLQTGAIKLHQKTLNFEIAERIRGFLCALAERKSYDKLILSNAFWLKGSRLCNGCSKRKDIPLLCSIYQSCSGPRSTANYFAKGAWYPEDEVFTRGDIRPGYGMPTQVPERQRTRKDVPVIPIIPLFE